MFKKQKSPHGTLRYPFWGNEWWIYLKLFEQNLKYLLERMIFDSSILYFFINWNLFAIYVWFEIIIISILERMIFWYLLFRTSSIPFFHCFCLHKLQPSYISLSLQIYLYTKYSFRKFKKFFKTFTINYVPTFWLWVSIKKLHKHIYVGINICKNCLKNIQFLLLCEGLLP